MNGETAQELSFYVSGGRIAAKVWGPEWGWPVLAVHGWLDNAGSFDALAPLLAGHLRIVAVDLSGHGLSYRKSPGAGYHFSDWLLEVHEVVGQLGWERFSFLGHSMGGQLGTVFAAMSPTRVRDLILLDTVGPVTVDTDAQSDRFSQHIVGRLAAAARPARVYPHKKALIDLMVRVAGMSRSAAEIILQRGAFTTPQGISFGYDRRARLNYPAVFTTSQAIAMLNRVCCPALLLKATQGYPYEPGYFESQAKALRYKQVIPVEGAHHFHLDRPLDTAELITAFLEKSASLASSPPQASANFA